MARKGRKFRITVSALRRYLSCPFQWHLHYQQPNLPKRTDYPRLLGMALHAVFKKLHEPTREARRFYFRSLNGLIANFRVQWKTKVTEAKTRGQLIVENELDDYGQELKHRELGEQCLRMYWREFEKLPPPLATEYRLRAKWSPNIVIEGTVDQIRAIPQGAIERHRPQIIECGWVKRGYAQVAIVDFKTGIDPYDIRNIHENREPTLMEMLRKQHAFHENIQGTTYTWLFEQVFGAKPVWFTLYYLQTGKGHRTWVDDEIAYRKLEAWIQHYIDNVAARSFPTKPGFECERCDYVAGCRAGREHLISRPWSMKTDLPAVEVIPNLIPVVQDPQRKLPLQMKRVPTAKPPELPKAPKPEFLMVPPEEEPERPKRPHQKRADEETERLTFAGDASVRR